LADGRQSSEELVVLDSAGRLQLPGEQRALAGIGRRARVELVDGGILIRATDDDHAEPTGVDAAAGPETTYQSLYSAIPPPSSADSATNGKRRWRLRRAKRDG
jgi:hypothetical protein